MNNFVFHEEYIIDLPEEKKSEFALYIINYGLYGETPSLMGFENVFWRTVQRRIDTDKMNYKASCLKQKISAINNRIKNQKATDKDLEHLKLFTAELNELNENKENILNNLKYLKYSENNEINKINNLKLTHHDIESDIDIEFESDIDIDTDIESEGPLVEAENPSVKAYSETIFNLFKENKLPCCKNNPVSFLQMDFKNAMAYIHNSAELKGLHSDDVIGAVKNYIECYKNPDSYITSKMNFYSLVKSKIFYNLLPANFSADNFRDFKKAEKPEEKKSEKTFLPDLCPNCKKPLLYWEQAKDKYICDGCSAAYDFTEIMGDYIGGEE